MAVDDTTAGRVALAVATSPDDDPDHPRPAEVGDATVEEFHKDHGRLLLVYRWPAAPA